MRVVSHDMPYWSLTDWKKLSPSTEYGVIIGRTVVWDLIFWSALFVSGRVVRWEGGKGGMVVKWKGGEGAR